jgi:hypothetical protein
MRSGFFVVGGEPPSLCPGFQRRFVRLDMWGWIPILRRISTLQNGIPPAGWNPAIHQLSRTWKISRKDRKVR